MEYRLNGIQALVNIKKREKNPIGKGTEFRAKAVLMSYSFPYNFVHYSM